ncbi:hypothetical protein P4282_07320 [Bacillus swezeyi]|uniref:hypothetical protein n=1 Tax=Bacillus swezeyi TaxID=1925020 RepID=UPI002E1E3ECD|nr:hypothetical protein [Bacillus swezeyi]
MTKRIFASVIVSILILILTFIISFILYAIASYFIMQLFVTGEPSQDEALGWGYLGLLFLSFILAIITGGIVGTIYFLKYFKNYKKKTMHKKEKTQTE